MLGPRPTGHYHPRVANRKKPSRKRNQFIFVLVAIACAPLLAINLAVAFCGQTLVFPLSPFFLRQKVGALEHFARHLPTCVLDGHASRLAPLVAAAERKHKLPPGLLAALVQVESGGRVHRISPAGAMGPGQLLPGTARMLEVDDPFSPVEAIDGSARYLAQQLERFGDVALAVAAYNAGPGNVKGRVPRNGETEFYVAHVMAEYERLRPATDRKALRERAAGRRGQEPGRKR